MLLYEFYRTFEYLPDADREKYIDKVWLGVLTPGEIHRRLKRIEREMKPLETERDELLAIAEDYFASRPKPKIDYRD